MTTTNYHFTFSYRFCDKTGSKRPWEVLSTRDDGMVEVCGSCATEENAKRSVRQWVRHQNKHFPGSGSAA